MSNVERQSRSLGGSRVAESQKTHQRMRRLRSSNYSMFSRDQIQLPPPMVGKSCRDVAGGKETMARTGAVRVVMG